MKTDRPKPFTFVIRGLQFTRVIERTFYAESEADRESWITAIEQVAQAIHDQDPNIFQLQESSRSVSMDSCDSILRSSHNYPDQDLTNKFGMQGFSLLSGTKKVVSLIILDLKNTIDSEPK